MGKMHEILAVEPEIKTTSETILAETINTFSKKQDHFDGHTRNYAPVQDGGETYPNEDKDLVTTVRDKLEYARGAISRHLDLIYQKELCNTHARSDLVLDGKVVATGVPATVLLSLENKLKHIKQMYVAIPTLEPGERWVQHTHQANVYRAEPKVTLKTNKILTHKVVVPPTDKHPAQVAQLSEDVRVGTWTTTKFSGKLTPLEKSTLLARVDTLIGAVKKARCRANEAEAQHAEIGKIVFDFIDKGTV